MATTDNTDELQLTKSLSMAELAVADMANEGLTPIQIAIGLASVLNQQVAMAMPRKDLAMIFKLSLIGASS